MEERTPHLGVAVGPNHLKTYFEVRTFPRESAPVIASSEISTRCRGRNSNPEGGSASLNYLVAVPDCFYWGENFQSRLASPLIWMARAPVAEGGASGTRELEGGGDSLGGVSSEACFQ